MEDTLAQSHPKSTNTSKNPLRTRDNGNDDARTRSEARMHETAEPSLGKLTKNADTFVDPETGEVVSFQRVTAKDGSQKLVKNYDQDAADLERWMLKQHARRLLMKIEERDKKVKVEFMDDYGNTVTKYRQVVTVSANDRGYENEYHARKNAPVYRVVNCSRSTITSKDKAEIWHAHETDRCSFHNVSVCGSVWTCPTCSLRINVARQEQIRKCYEAFKQNGPFDTLMITFTIKHGYGDDLPDLFDKLSQADRKFLQKTYTYKKLVGYKRTIKGERVQVPSVYDYAGRISASEITYGKNGFHPHRHQLWFFKRKLTDKEIVAIRKALFKEWKAACLSVGLPAPVETWTDPATGKKKYVGVDVRRALSASEYLAKFGTDRKWSPEKEIASSHSKSGKSGKTAFELLADAATGDNRAAHLFRHYADATIGKHQLEWSTGLKKYLESLLPPEDVKDLDKTDEELAYNPDADSHKLGTLTDADFDALKKYKGPVEPFGTVLIIAKKQGFDAAVEWIRSLSAFNNTPEYSDIAIYKTNAKGIVEIENEKRKAKNLAAQRKAEKEARDAEYKHNEDTWFDTILAELK